MGTTHIKVAFLRRLTLVWVFFITQKRLNDWEEGNNEFNWNE